MRGEEEYESRMQERRRDWHTAFDRRWAKLDQTSETAKRRFQQWLEGFRPTLRGEQRDHIPSESADHARATTMLWILGIGCIVIWTVGMATSSTANGVGIHLALASGVILFTIAWIRRARERRHI